MSVILTIDQIVQNVINQLHTLDPSVSAEIGTPERKIIEAVAQMIAVSQVDFSVLNSQTDIDSMTGGTLDSYLGNFGFGRQQAVFSVGTVTFSRTSPATQSIIIPAGTQVIAQVDSTAFPSITFNTTQTVTLAVNTTSIDAPIQATTPGTIGNVSAGAITAFAGLKTISGISTISNSAATTGGADGEDDNTFRTRFKNTIFRNMAGTYDQFLALAVAVIGVTKANVVGPLSRYQEYIQIPAAKDLAQKTSDDSGANGGYDKVGTRWTAKRTSAASSIPYSKYTYDQQYYLTDGALGSSATFFRPFVDYVFNYKARDATNGGTNQVVLDTANVTAHKPNVTFLNAYDASDNAGGDTRLSENGIVLLEHGYISKASRNDYGLGILNAVDVFVNGENEQTVKSVEVMPTNSQNVQNTDTGVWTSQLDPTGAVNWKRKIDGRTATLGNRLQPLYWQPVLSLPNSITISDGTDTNVYHRANYYKVSNTTYYNKFDGTTYTVPAHYAVVEEVNGYYGTVRCRNGIEWFAGINGVNTQGATHPALYYGGTQFTVDSYTWDENISDLQAIMEKNKQVTSDVLVHRALVRYFIPIVTIMYTPGVSQTTVNAAIIVALQNFFNNQYYGSAIQLSDILQAIHNVPGVDNVRWTNEDPGTGVKLHETHADGDYVNNNVFNHIKDFFIKDSELASSPTTNQVLITVRAANTWST